MTKEKTIDYNTDDKEAATAVKLVNDALIKVGLEAEFDVKLKSILILIINEALKKGFDKGFKKAKQEVMKKVREEFEVPEEFNSVLVMRAIRRIEYDIGLKEIPTEEDIDNYLKKKKKHLK